MVYQHGVWTPPHTVRFCPSEPRWFSWNAGHACMPLNHQWFPEETGGAQQCLRKGKNGEMLLQNLMLWVQFPSFPNSCFRPSSCSISGKVQTTSEGKIRHQVLAKEQQGVSHHPFVAQQAAPAAIFSHGGHCPVDPSKQRPNQAVLLTALWAGCTERVSLAGAPVSHAIQRCMEATTRFCCSECCSMADHASLSARCRGVPQSPPRYRGLCSAHGHIWSRGHPKADPALGWSVPAVPPSLCEGAVEQVALEGSALWLSQCREWSCSGPSPRHPWHISRGHGGETPGAAADESLMVAGGTSSSTTKGVQKWPKFVTPPASPTSTVPSAQWQTPFSCFTHLWSQPLRPGKAVAVT